MKKLDVIFKLTEARLALAEGVMGIAKDKFEEVLAMDPDNIEAKEFLDNYEKGIMPERSQIISLGPKPEPSDSSAVETVRKTVSVPSLTFN